MIKAETKKIIKSSLFFEILFVVIALLIIFSGNIKTQLYKWDLLPHPETFTELYFENHTLLPTKVEAGEPYTFSFTTHNLEYKTMTYTYQIQIQDGSRKTTIQKAKFTLNQNQKKTIKETFTAPQLSNRSMVAVDLTNKNNQQIDFWITE